MAQANRTSPGIVEMTEPRRSKACLKPRPCTPSRHAGSRCWCAMSGSPICHCEPH